jgi:hypothetical protein
MTLGQLRGAAMDHKFYEEYFSRVAGTLFKQRCLIAFVLDDTTFIKDILDLDKVKMAEKFIKDLEENFKNISDVDITNPDNLLLLANVSSAIGSIHHLEYRIEDFNLEILGQEVLERSNRALGYWTAETDRLWSIQKGAMKRREITKRKLESLRAICKKYNIYCAKDLKNGREIFMAEAKHALELQSERRIEEYLKEIEKETKLTQNRAKKD